MSRLDRLLGVACVVVATLCVAIESYTAPAFILGVFLLNILDELRKR